MTPRTRRRFDLLFWPRFALGLLRYRRPYGRAETVMEHSRLRRQIERGEDAGQ